MTYSDLMTLFVLYFVFTTFYNRGKYRRLRRRFALYIVTTTTARLIAKTEYRTGLDLARRGAIHETMECARGIVRSHGGADLTEARRETLCGAMDHYERTAR
jgi:hypothetical protein